MDMQSLIATLFGGAISLFTSLFVLWQRARIEGEQKEKEKSENAVEAVRSAISKLMETANIALNQKNFIDGQYKKIAELKIGSQIDPAMVVLPMIGSRDAIPYLTNDEMKFIRRADEGLLATRVNVIQKRIDNNVESLERYSNLRFQYDEWMIEAAAPVGEPNGTEVTMEFDLAASKLSNLKIGRLNSILGDIITFIENDSIEIKKITEECVLAAKEQFPDEFKNLTVKWDLSNE